MHHQRGDAKATLAIADSETSAVHLFDARSGAADPYTAVQVHSAPVAVMRYNPTAEAVVSADTRGRLLVHVHVCHVCTCVYLCVLV